MAMIACSTWDGGGNVAVFRALAHRLRERGHEVAIQIEWGARPRLDGDVLLVDHMSPVEVLREAVDSCRPVTTVVHTLWSFVPALEGTFAPPGFLDVLHEVDRNLVFTIPELDGVGADGNVAHVGPVFEPPPVGATWSRPNADRAFVVVSLGTTDMGEVDVLQRVLDGLGSLDADVLATVGSHVDRSELRVPANAIVHGFVSHQLTLPVADLFVGHGGHGGIMAALASGIPIVALPLDRDQPHNAARLAATGAGVHLDKDADPEAIAAAVSETLGQVELRTAARRLADAISALDGEPLRQIDALLDEA